MLHDETKTLSSVKNQMFLFAKYRHFDFLVTYMYTSVTLNAYLNEEKLLFPC